MNFAMEETKKRSHHAAKSSRPCRVEVMFTEEEMKLIDYRLSVVSNGKKMSRSAYIREMSLKGGVWQAVSAEDRKTIARLSNLGTNLWNLRKTLHNEGMLGHEIKVKNIITDLEKEIAFFQDKLSK